MILLIVAVLALGWGLVQLVALPFGGLDPAISIFWGFLLVLVVLGVLFLVGRRRQSAARARRRPSSAPTRWAPAVRRAAPAVAAAGARSRAAPARATRLTGAAPAALEEV